MVSSELSKPITVKEGIPVRMRSLLTSAFSKQYFQKRYVSLWVLAILFPYIVLRSMIVDTPFELVASFHNSWQPGHLDLPSTSGSPPATTQRDVQSTVTREGSLVRRDEDAWPSPADWKNHGNSPQVKAQNNNGSTFALTRNPEDIEKTHSANGSHPSPLQVEKFGSLEDSEKEQPTSLVRAEEEKEKATDDDGRNIAGENEEALTNGNSAEKIATKAEDERRAEEKRNEKMADEQREAEEKRKLADEQRVEAEHKDAEQKIEAEHKDAEQKIEAEHKDAEQKSEAEHKDAEQKIEAEHKDAEQNSEAEHKDAELRKQPDERANRPEEKEQQGGKAYENPRPAENVTIPNDHAPEAIAPGKCDLFDGDWVHDPESPPYTNATCSYIENEQNCFSNGRPDREYLDWKWKPRECDLPRFDAKLFLNTFRGKTIGFVGDSIARNQMQSLLCLLEKVEKPSVTEAWESHSTVYLFGQHQVTVIYLRSTFLLKESLDGIMGFEEGQSVVYLDALDTTWTDAMSQYDIMIYTTGPWYLAGSVYVKQDEVIGCHNCGGLNLTELGFSYGFKEGLRLVLDKVATEFKGVAIMNTYTVVHFEGGGWADGGSCRRQSPLEKDEGAHFPGPHKDFHDIAVNEFEIITNDKNRLSKDVHMELVDMTRVSAVRADGHPGPYRVPYPYQGRNSTEWVQNDCVHWCLPGPVDTWNQLLVQILQKYI